MLANPSHLSPHGWDLTRSTQEPRSNYPSPGQGGPSPTLIILINLLKFLTGLKKKTPNLREIDNNHCIPQKSSVLCSHLFLFAERIEILVVKAQQLPMISSASYDQYYFRISVTPPCLCSFQDTVTVIRERY